MIRFWNNGQQEVDFVVQQGGELIALEVKSSPVVWPVPGLEAFLKVAPSAHPTRLGAGGVPLDLWFG